LNDLALYIWTAFIGNFTNPDGYFYWGWILLYIGVGAGMGYFAARARGERYSPQTAWNACFPAKTFRGKSAVLDYQIFVLSGCLILYPLSFFLMKDKFRLLENVAAGIERGLSVFGSVPIPVTHGFWIDAVYSLLLLFAADFGWTVQHLFFHRIPWLWEFHKVHHSAKQLNLVTVTRLHPLEVFAQSWATGLCIGVALGICKFLLGYTPSVATFLNVSWALVAYRIIGIYRHSHLWIPLPRFLSHIVCSPAMHHIHHSVDKKHLDKNFCNVFSFWDFVFGTIYIPEKKEDLKYGLAGNPNPLRPYDTFWGCLLHPFLTDKYLRRIQARRSADKTNSPIR